MDQKMTIGCVATMPGRENVAWRMIKSVAGQLQTLFVVANPGTNIDKLSALVGDTDNVSFIVSDEDLADNGKFWALMLFGVLEEAPNWYYFCLDDDLIYPETYVYDMCAAIDEKGCIVTHHGRILKKHHPWRYYGGPHRQFRCLAENRKACFVDVAGTGVTAFHTSYFFPANLSESKHKKMADLVFSLEATKEGRKIFVLPHSQDYFAYLYPENTIFDEFQSRGQEVQNTLSREIFNLRYC